MLQLLLGKDWITVRNEILSRIASDVAECRGGRILMVPELISHETERLLCETAGDTASRYAEVLSFTRMARRVADGGFCSLTPCLDEGGRVVAMAAAARQLHSRLKAYASVETQPEFWRNLSMQWMNLNAAALLPGIVLWQLRRAKAVLRRNWRSYPCCWKPMMRFAPRENRIPVTR